MGPSALEVAWAVVVLVEPLLIELIARLVVLWTVVVA